MYWSTRSSCLLGTTLSHTSKSQLNIICQGCKILEISADTYSKFAVTAQKRPEITSSIEPMPSIQFANKNWVQSLSPSSLKAIYEYYLFSFLWIICLFYMFLHIFFISYFYIRLLNNAFFVHTQWNNLCVWVWPRLIHNTCATDGCFMSSTVVK